MTHPQVPWQFQDMDNGFIRFSKGSIVPNRLSGKNVGSWSKGRSPKSFLAVWWSWGRLLPRSSAEWAELVWLIWFPLLKDGKGMTYTRLSHIWLLASLWTVAHQASLSTEFSRPRNWCFQIVVLEKILRVLCTARRSNQPILKEINREYPLEGLMLKLKLQYLGHLMGRADSFEKTQMLGKTEGRRRRDDRAWDGWIASSTWWTWVWVNSGSWWWTGRPGIPGVAKESDTIERLNWTELKAFRKLVMTAFYSMPHFFPKRSK